VVCGGDAGNPQRIKGGEIENACTFPEEEGRSRTVARGEEALDATQLKKEKKGAN